MTSLTSVKDHMEQDPVTLSPDMDVEEAVLLLLKHKVSRAPVVDSHGTLIGILAEGDCLEAFLNEEYFESPAAVVGDLMTSEIVTVDSEVDILTTAGLFLQHVSGSGIALIHGSGDFVEHDLAAGASLLVSTGNLAAFADSVDYDIQGVAGCRRIAFGGEGLFMTRLTGPGRVLLQSLKRTAPGAKKGGGGS